MKNMLKVFNSNSKSFSTTLGMSIATLFSGAVAAGTFVLGARELGKDVSEIIHGTSLVNRIISVVNFVHHQDLAIAFSAATGLCVYLTLVTAKKDVQTKTPYQSPPPPPIFDDKTPSAPSTPGSF